MWLCVSMCVRVCVCVFAGQCVYKCVYASIYCTQQSFFTSSRQSQSYLPLSWCARHLSCPTLLHRRYPRIYCRWRVWGRGGSAESKWIRGEVLSMKHHEASPQIQFSSILFFSRSDWGPDPCPSLWALFASFGHAHGILSQITIPSHFFEIGHLRRRISDQTGRRPSGHFKSLSFQTFDFEKK